MPIGRAEPVQLRRNVAVAQRRTITSLIQSTNVATCPFVRIFGRRLLLWRRLSQMITDSGLALIVAPSLLPFVQSTFQGVFQRTLGTVCCKISHLLSTGSGIEQSSHVM